MQGLTDIDGDGQADDLAAGTTATGFALVAINETMAGTYTNTAKATGYISSFYTYPVLTDSDTASDNETILYTDVAPTATLAKDPSVTIIDGMGGTVVYTFKVTNTSFEPIMLTSMTDTLFSEITLTALTWKDSSGNTIADISTYWIAPSAYVTAAFSKVFTADELHGFADDNYIIHNVATVGFRDYDGSTGTATDYADVTVIPYHDETAWAYGGTGIAKGFSSLNLSNWGWSNYLGSETGTYTWKLIAGAGTGDNPDNGEWIGNLTVVRTSTILTVTFTAFGNTELLDTHLWVGATPLPVSGKKTIANPGQFAKYLKYPSSMEVRSDQEVVYTLKVSSKDKIYIAAHTSVRIYYWED